MSGPKVAVTNAELVQSFNALSVLGAEKFGITFAFKLQRVLKSMQSQMEVYQAARAKILEEHAERGEDGKFLTQAGGTEYKMQGKEWQPKIKELDSLEAGEVDTISAKEIIAACDISELTVSANLLLQLGKVLVDDAELE